ncbi:hypothetical protein CsatB_018655 [Cannabis sativa]|uniref:uncharacterized protein LOC133035534 n=1 Tax=Cannabis sativa TaxID=3483 RepID=UPI0029C9C716|nr:uncharacterized protein LOC133035534 [Cannabis sativa]
MVAAISAGTTPSFYTQNPIKRQLPKLHQSGVVLVCCLNRREEQINGTTTTNKEAKEEKKMNMNMMMSFDKFGKCLRENLSPKQKGDWKDLTLMSLSFAVYVYISQKIVCAYFAWVMSMPKQLW